MTGETVIVLGVILAVVGLGMFGGGMVLAPLRSRAEDVLVIGGFGVFVAADAVMVIGAVIAG